MPNPLNRDPRSPVYNSFGAENGIPFDPPVGREMVIADPPISRGGWLKPLGGYPSVVEDTPFACRQRVVETDFSKSDIKL